MVDKFPILLGGFGVSPGCARFSKLGLWFRGLRLNRTGFRVLKSTGCGFAHFLCSGFGISFKIPIFRFFEVIQFIKKLAFECVKRSAESRRKRKCWEQSKITVGNNAPYL